MTIADSTITEDQVSFILKIEEGHFIDLKAIEISPAAVTRTVSAFANTSGGEIYVGIDERIGADGRERAWRGFDAKEDANGLLQSIEAMSPLGMHYAAEFIRCDKTKGAVVHITIFKSKDILKASDGKIYVRCGAQKLPVEGDEALQRLKYDKGIKRLTDERRPHRKPSSPIKQKGLSASR